ncbi:Conserved_hypothetical protein [Hexamita inflata]|uniref:Uncharacterized protein n=1 Tax=Hexamita inflata TaxID=28002 RepID=A0AA86U0D0_9EUKA|nr:Conserved hypothetical protein [Hexamita inflata]
MLILKGDLHYSTWQRDNPYIKHLKIKGSDQFIEGIAYETLYKKAPTQIEHFEFDTVNLQQANDFNIKHTCKKLTFINCNFDNISLIEFPNIQEIKVINCTGHLKLLINHKYSLILFSRNDQNIIRSNANCRIVFMHEAQDFQLQIRILQGKLKAYQCQHVQLSQQNVMG